MQHRLLVVLISLAVILSTVPLYKTLKQDYLPGNVDESEFNVNVTAPQGTSLASMDEIMNAIGKEIRDVPGVQLVLTTAGGGFIGGVSEGRTYVRLAPHGSVCFPWGCSHGTLLQANHSKHSGRYPLKSRLCRR